MKVVLPLDGLDTKSHQIFAQSAYSFCWVLFEAPNTNSILTYKLTNSLVNNNKRPFMRKRARVCVCCVFMHSHSSDTQNSSWTHKNASTQGSRTFNTGILCVCVCMWYILKFYNTRWNVQQIVYYTTFDTITLQRQNNVFQPRRVSFRAGKMCLQKLKPNAQNIECSIIWCSAEENP